MCLKDKIKSAHQDFIDGYKELLFVVNVGTILE